jgi:hypothetical protein
VSDEFRDDCARFLQELRTTIDRRDGALPQPRTGWVPRAKQ